MPNFERHNNAQKMAKTAKHRTKSHTHTNHFLVVGVLLRFGQVSPLLLVAPHAVVLNAGVRCTEQRTKKGRKKRKKKVLMVLMTEQRTN